jgi:hypothetical protein
MPLTGDQMYIKLTNGTPTAYTMGNLRRDNPAVSFPRNIPLNVLAEYQVYPVTVLPAPVYDPVCQYLELSDYTETASGWQVSHRVVNLPEAQAAHNQTQKRNQLLAETDWQMLPDTGADTPENRAYRQALRDITDQPGFPWDIQWPQKPTGDSQ